MERRAFFKFTLIGLVGLKLAPTVAKTPNLYVKLIKDRKLYKRLQVNAMHLGDKILEAYYRMKQMNIKHLINNTAGNSKVAFKDWTDAKKIMKIED